MDVADLAEIDDLFAGEPEQFTAARDALVKRLRSEKRREEANQVAKLRRPTTVAWAMNQAARVHPAVIDELEAAGVDARTAQEDVLRGGPVSTLHEAIARRRSVVLRLVGFAADVLVVKGVAADPHRADMRSTFEAASVDDETRTALRKGRLSAVVAPGSFDLEGGVWTAVSTAAPDGATSGGATSGGAASGGAASGGATSGGATSDPETCDAPENNTSNRDGSVDGSDFTDPGGSVQQDETAIDGVSGNANDVELSELAALAERERERESFALAARREVARRVAAAARDQARVELDSSRAHLEAMRRESQLATDQVAQLQTDIVDIEARLAGLRTALDDATTQLRATEVRQAEATAMVTATEALLAEAENRLRETQLPESSA